MHDGYLAMWQLAISYYETQIYASGCGNFGSNATLPDDIQHTSSLNSSFSPFGLHVKVSQQVELKDVSITHIDSDEGFAIGIDIAPDQNDRSDYRDRRAVTFDDVRVDALTAGRKSMVAHLGDDQFNMKEFKTGQPVDNGNWFKPPKLVIKQEQGCCSNRVCLSLFGQK